MSINQVEELRLQIQNNFRETGYWANIFYGRCRLVTQILSTAIFDEANFSVSKLRIVPDTSDGALIPDLSWIDRYAYPQWVHHTVLSIDGKVYDPLFPNPTPVKEYLDEIFPGQQSQQTTSPPLSVEEFTSIYGEELKKWEMRQLLTA